MALQRSRRRPVSWLSQPGPPTVLDFVKQPILPCTHLCPLVTHKHDPFRRLPPQSPRGGATGHRRAARRRPRRVTRAFGAVRSGTRGAPERLRTAAAASACEAAVGRRQPPRIASVSRGARAHGGAPRRVPPRHGRRRVRRPLPGVATRTAAATRQGGGAHCGYLQHVVRAVGLRRRVDPVSPARAWTSASPRALPAHAAGGRGGSGGRRPDGAGHGAGISRRYGGRPPWRRAPFPAGEAPAPTSVDHPACCMVHLALWSCPRRRWSARRRGGGGECGGCRPAAATGGPPAGGRGPRRCIPRTAGTPDGASAARTFWFSPNKRTAPLDFVPTCKDKKPQDAVPHTVRCTPFPADAPSARRRRSSISPRLPPPAADGEKIGRAHV